MKNLFVAVTALFATASCEAQDAPVAVKTAFAKKFPGITAKKWEKENGKYEARFTKDGKIVSATFSVSGTWEETETDIKITELPAAITSYIKANYKGKTIKEAAIISSPATAKMYEAEVNGTDLMFDENGRFVKAVKEQEDKKEEKD